MSNFSKSQRAIIAILSELEAGGARELTTTSLVKYVYLVDYAHAKENAGEILTGHEWRFLHFGPFDAALMSDIETLERHGILSLRSGGGTSKDYQLYSLAGHITRSTLEGIGLARRAASHVRQYLQFYSGDLSKLLNFVYFRTEPMHEAEPGAVLDFSVCRADKWEDIKPLQAKPLPSGAVKLFRERLAARRQADEANKRPPIIWDGVYDAVYQQAMTFWDKDEGETVPEPYNSGILAL